MIVKITSDVTNEEYSGESYEEVMEAMTKAEKAYVEAQSAKVNEAIEEATELEEDESSNSHVSEEAARLHTEKKQLCAKINDARKEKLEAENQRKEAEENARQIIAEAMSKARQLVSEARQKESEAGKVYWKYIAEYNTKFNKPYTRLFYGKDAFNEYRNLLIEADSMFENACKIFADWFKQ